MGRVWSFALLLGLAFAFPARMVALPDSLHIRSERICWVSPNGDNTSARMGDSTRAWADPWTAVAHAPDSSWIVVLPGHWTFGLAGFGAQYEITAAAQANLLKRPDLRFYFHAEAFIEKIGPFTGGDQPTGLFAPRHAGHFEVHGSGTFWWDTEVYRHSICYLDHPEASLRFSAHEIRYGTYGFALYRFDTVRLQINQVRRVNYSVSTISLRHRGSQSHCYLEAHIKDYDNTPGDSDYSGIFSTRCCGPEVQFEESEFRIRIDRILKKDPLGSTHAALGGDYGYLLGLVHDSRFRCSKIHFSIGTAIYQQLNTDSLFNTVWTTSLPPTYTTQAAFQVGSAVLENSEMHLQVDTLISDFPALVVNFQTPDSRGQALGLIQVKGFFQTLQQGLILEGGNTDSLKQITFSGQLVSRFGPWLGDRRTEDAKARINFYDWTVQEGDQNRQVLGHSPWIQLGESRLEVAMPDQGLYWFIPPEWQAEKRLLCVVPQALTNYLQEGLGAPLFAAPKANYWYIDWLQEEWYRSVYHPLEASFRWIKM